MCSGDCCIGFDEESERVVVRCPGVGLDDEIRSAVEGLEELLLAGGGKLLRRRVDYEFSVPVEGEFRAYDIRVSGDGRVSGKRDELILTYIAALLDAILATLLEKRGAG